jgi:hypothetical protein
MTVVSRSPDGCDVIGGHQSRPEEWIHAGMKVTSGNDRDRKLFPVTEAHSGHVLSNSVKYGIEVSSLSSRLPSSMWGILCRMSKSRAVKSDATKRDVEKNGVIFRINITRLMFAPSSSLYLKYRTILCWRIAAWKSDNGRYTRRFITTIIRTTFWPINGTEKLSLFCASFMTLLWSLPYWSAWLACVNCWTFVIMSEAILCMLHHLTEVTAWYRLVAIATVEDLLATDWVEWMARVHKCLCCTFSQTFTILENIKIALSTREGACHLNSRQKFHNADMHR